MVHNISLRTKTVLARRFSGCLSILALALVAIAGLAACGGDESLTVYSGRTESLVGPVLEKFTESTGIKVVVRYDSSASIAATILEEGNNSPADVVFLQDPGSMGALSLEGVLSTLPDALLQQVSSDFRSPRGEWVGTSGRARTVVYNTEAVNRDTDLPESIFGFTDPQWHGRIGWAPTNGSFQAFVTGLRVLVGEEKAKRWLEEIRANDPQDYSNNTSIVQAVARGEVEVGFVNHYYLHRFLAEEGSGFGARNYYIGGGDPGGLVLVAGVGILKTSKQRDKAKSFIDYMLSQEAQEFFVQETKEFPVISGIQTVEGLPSIEDLEPPSIDVSELADLRGTLDLLREVGILP